MGQNGRRGLHKAPYILIIALKVFGTQVRGLKQGHSSLTATGHVFIVGHARSPTAPLLARNI